MTVHVLVVDDDNALRGWVARGLERGGCTVTQADSGEHALALLRQTGSSRPPFDVVVADIVMGEVDGIAVIEVVRSQPDPAEVLLLTSNGALDTAAAAIRLGAFDYLLKPVQPTALLRRVLAAAERRQERRQQAGEAAAWRTVAEVLRGVEPAAPPADAPAVEMPVRIRVLGRLTIDTQRHEVRCDGRRVSVTPIEYTILSTLSERPAEVVAYGALAQRTHGIMLSEREAYGLLRTHVRNLRHKIGDGYLLSVRGVGYLLDAAEDTTLEDDTSHSS